VFLANALIAKKAGDLIIAVNGRMLAQNIKKDDFFFQLLDTARPISIGFMRQQQQQQQQQSEGSWELPEESY
jgi:hypothetical protein